MDTTNGKLYCSNNSLKICNRLLQFSQYKVAPSNEIFKLQPDIDLFDLMKTIADFICKLSDDQIRTLPKLGLLTVKSWINQNVKMVDNQVNIVGTNGIPINSTEPIGTSNTNNINSTSVTSYSVDSIRVILSSDSSISSNSSCDSDSSIVTQSTVFHNSIPKSNINKLNQNILVNRSKKLKATVALENTKKKSLLCHTKIDFPSPEEYNIRITPYLTELSSKVKQHLSWKDATQYIQLNDGYKLLYAIDGEWFFRLLFNGISISNEIIGSRDDNILAIGTFQMKRVECAGIMIKALILFLKSDIDIVRKYTFKFCKFLTYKEKIHQSLNIYYKYLHNNGYLAYCDTEYVYFL
jgi:hypothetical protein